MTAVRTLSPDIISVSYTHLDVYKRQLKWLSKTFVWIIRGTPLMLQLFVVLYVPGLLFNTPIKAVSYTHLDVYKRPEIFP